MKYQEPPRSSYSSNYRRVSDYDKSSYKRVPEDFIDDDYEYRERKIGEIFEMNGDHYLTFEQKGCSGCDFRHGTCSIYDMKGVCSGSMRKDGKSVSFKKLRSKEDWEDALIKNKPWHLKK